MTILVDAPRWEWRERRWAHLVSDTSYDELHDFARRLGKRRLGFQGDHYDIDEIDHTRALGLGAQPVDGRDLVRRLRSAGLRRRDGKPRWREVGRWPEGVGATAFAAALRPHGAEAERLVAAVAAHGRLAERVALAAYADPDHLVALLELGAGDGAPELTLDVDLHVIGGRRADETSSIELFVRR